MGFSWLILVTTMRGTYNWGAEKVACMEAPKLGIGEGAIPPENWSSDPLLLNDPSLSNPQSEPGFTSAGYGFVIPYDNPVLAASQKAERKSDENDWWYVGSSMIYLQYLTVGLVLALTVGLSDAIQSGRSNKVLAGVLVFCFFVQRIVIRSFDKYGYDLAVSQKEEIYGGFWLYRMTRYEHVQTSLIYLALHLGNVIWTYWCGEDFSLLSAPLVTVSEAIAPGGFGLESKSLSGDITTALKTRAAESTNYTLKSHINKSNPKDRTFNSKLIPTDSEQHQDSASYSQLAGSIEFKASSKSALPPSGAVRANLEEGPNLNQSSRPFSQGLPGMMVGGFRASDGYGPFISDQNSAKPHLRHGGNSKTSNKISILELNQIPRVPGDNTATETDIGEMRFPGDTSGSHSSELPPRLTSDEQSASRISALRDGKSISNVSAIGPRFTVTASRNPLSAAVQATQTLKSLRGATKSVGRAAGSTARRGSLGEREQVQALAKTAMTSRKTKTGITSKSMRPQQTANLIGSGVASQGKTTKVVDIDTLIEPGNAPPTSSVAFGTHITPESNSTHAPNFRIPAVSVTAGALCSQENCETTNPTDVEKPGGSKETTLDESSRAMNNNSSTDGGEHGSCSLEGRSGPVACVTFMPTAEGSRAMGKQRTVRKKGIGGNASAGTNSLQLGSRGLPGDKPTRNSSIDGTSVYHPDNTLTLDHLIEVRLVSRSPLPLRLQGQFVWNSEFVSRHIVRLLIIGTLGTVIASSGVLDKQRTFRTAFEEEGLTLNPSDSKLKNSPVSLTSISPHYARCTPAFRYSIMNHIISFWSAILLTSAGLHECYRPIIWLTMKEPRMWLVCLMCWRPFFCRIEQQTTCLDELSLARAAVGSKVEEDIQLEKVFIYLRQIAMATVSTVALSLNDAIQSLDPERHMITLPILSIPKIIVQYWNKIKQIFQNHFTKLSKICTNRLPKQLCQCLNLLDKLRHFQLPQKARAKTVLYGIYLLLMIQIFLTEGRSESIARKAASRFSNGDLRDPRYWTGIKRSPNDSKFDSSDFIGRVKPHPESFLLISVFFFIHKKNLFLEKSFKFFL